MSPEPGEAWGSRGLHPADGPFSTSKLQQQTQAHNMHEWLSLQKLTVRLPKDTELMIHFLYVCISPILNEHLVGKHSAVLFKAIFIHTWIHSPLETAGQSYNQTLKPWEHWGEVAIHPEWDTGPSQVP